MRRLDDTPRGLLRISIPPMLGQDLLAPSLIKYTRLYPEVRLEVMATTRHVDLVADRVDVALRAGTVHDPTLIVRRLWQMRASLVASPAYLARHGTPRDADALMHHHCIVGFERGELPQRAWPLRGGGEVRVAGRLAFNEPLLALIACVAGEGITLINRLMADPAIASGALVPLLEDEVGFEASLSVVYPSREQLEPKVRAFVDLIIAELPDMRHDEAMRAHIEAVVRRASAL